MFFSLLVLFLFLKNINIFIIILSSNYNIIIYYQIIKKKSCCKDIYIYIYIYIYLKANEVEIKDKLGEKIIEGIIFSKKRRRY